LPFVKRVSSTEQLLIYRYSLNSVHVAFEVES
jgi:hypothetical protein